MALPMLRSTTVGALDRALADWVEPVRNYVLADRDGRIAYRTAGRVPDEPPGAFPLELRIARALASLLAVAAGTFLEPRSSWHTALAGEAEVTP